MPRWMVRWGLNIVAIMVTAWLVPHFDVNSWWAAVLGSIVLAVLNAVVKPLIVLLTLPINLLTLGLFTLVINGFILWLVSKVVSGFIITGFGWAIVAALTLSIFSIIINLFVGDE